MNSNIDVLLPIGFSILVIAFRLATVYSGPKMWWISIAVGLMSVFLAYSFGLPVLLNNVGQPLVIVGVIMLIQQEIQKSPEKKPWVPKWALITCLIGLAPIAA